MDKLEDYEIKEKFKEYYRIIVTFNRNDYINESYSSEVAKDFEEYFIAIYILFQFFLVFSKYELSTEEKEFIKNFLEQLLKLDFIDVREIKLGKKDSEEINVKFYENHGNCFEKDRYLNKNYKIEKIEITGDYYPRFGQNRLITNLKNVKSNIEERLKEFSKAELIKSDVISFLKTITVSTYLINQGDDVVLRKIVPKNKTLHEKFMSI